MTDRDWICGTPYVLEAVRAMARARAALEDGSRKGRESP